MNTPNLNHSEEIISQLVERVRAASVYRTIDADFIRRIAARELQKGRGFKNSVKAIRNKLHQVGGAYFNHPVDYQQLSQELNILPQDPEDPALRHFCQRVMHLHASARERLRILEDFFTRTLNSIAPVHSVLDLACGLNPLAIPWMPLALEAPYYACDMYTDMLEFINHFFSHISRTGNAAACDLVEGIFNYPRVHLAMLLKSLPCLEQLDKQIGKRLLQSIPADYILISFPGRSLGGQNKGMFKNYTRHFEELIYVGNWQMNVFEFSNELAYLIWQ